MSTEPKPLQSVVALDAYRADDRGHIFPSDTSLRWFIRTRRELLLERRALLVLNGRLMIDAKAFDQVVLECGHAAAGREVA